MTPRSVRVCKAVNPLSHLGFRRFAPTSPAACGGLCKRARKSTIELTRGAFSCSFAVRGGFEPPVRLPVRQFSKLVVSATHPSHQN